MKQQRSMLRSVNFWRGGGGGSYWNFDCVVNSGIGFDTYDAGQVKVGWCLLCTCEAGLQGKVCKSVRLVSPLLLCMFPARLLQEIMKHVK